MAALSLIPSATEIVIALGAADRLAAVSDDCRNVPGAEALPVVSRAALSGLMSPAAIDRAVRSRLASDRSLYELDAAAIAALAPEVVFAQDECSVCALPSSRLLSALADGGASCEVVSLDPRDLEQVFASFETVAASLGLEGEGDLLQAACREELGRLHKDRDRRLLVLDWPEPAFAAGNWVPELVSAIGAVPIGPPAGTPSEEIVLEDLLASADAVVVAPCGLPLAEAVSAGERLARRHGRQSLLWCALDGRHFFSRPGPGLVAGARLLASFLEGEALPADLAVRLED